MEGKDIHITDQASSDIRDYFVPHLKSFFDACLKNGFTRDEAYRLTELYMEITLRGRD